MRLNSGSVPCRGESSEQRAVRVRGDGETWRVGGTTEVAAQALKTAGIWDLGTTGDPRVSGQP